MYQTTPDDPANVVGRLRHRHSSEAVLLGEYSLDGSKVRCCSLCVFVLYLAQLLDSMCVCESKILGYVLLLFVTVNAGQPVHVCDILTRQNLLPFVV